MKVTIYSGPPSGGKTAELINEMATSQGKYVFALPRIELINEKLADLERAAQRAGTAPILMPIHNKAVKKARVARAIDEARLDHETASHVVLLVTHEGMMGVDMSDFHGWRVRIDENPNSVSNGAFKASASSGTLAEIYDLERGSSPDWSILRVKESAPTKASILQDAMAQSLADIHKRATSPQGVLVDVADWDDLRDSGRRMNWLSVWTPLDLETCEDVVIAAAGYFTGIGHLVAEKLFPGQIEYSKRLFTPSGWSQRRFKIHYFTAGHRGSTTFWERPEGKDCLVAVSRHLEHVELGYWSCNEAIDLAFHGRLKGVKVSPKVEGTNSLMAHHSCALIYSSKSLPQDEVLIRAIGLTADQIERAREIEDIGQFIMRGAVRDPAFSGDYDIWLYDKHQADALADYLNQNGLGDVELVAVEEAGIMDVERERKRRTTVQADERSKKQRADERRAKNTARRRNKREQDRNQKISDGSYRGRGRPRREEGGEPAPVVVSGAAPSALPR